VPDPPRNGGPGGAWRSHAEQRASPHLPLILKLGGSLAETGRLSSLLELVKTTNRPVVIVPGGGPFADSIRTLQPAMTLPVALAHRLALLAMHQMGLVIASHDARLMPCETLVEINAALAAHHIPVWMPFALQSNDETLPADWTTTSDALAARLAERLGGATVALVKSCPIPGDATLASLAESGITDPVFHQVVTRANLPWAVFGAGDEAEMREWLG
jgi:5-(aminomethyl)-3-furanmethanol phosphate kinase